MDNKFPGKDISSEDLKDKFPLSSSINKKKIIKSVKSLNVNTNVKLKIADGNLEANIKKIN